MNDIIVIGGGIAGISAAATLAPDAHVTVLEAENALGYHASGRSAALIEKNYGAPAVRALNHATIGYLEKGGYLTQRGLLIVAEADDRHAFDADVADMGVTPIDTAEALAMVPILDPKKLAFAGYHADAHDIDTDRLLQDFARVVRAKGSEIVTDAKVTKITRENSKWRVSTAQETYTADLIINAAGAWADQIAQIADIAPMGITPYRRSMARIPLPGEHDATKWPMFFGTSESWYAKPDAGALLVSPAEEDPTTAHDAWADDMVLAEGIARYENMVTHPVTRLLASWAGLRSFASDRSLVLGRDPHTPSFIWCAGQGGYGFQTSAGAARLLADLIMGRSPELPPKIVAQLTPGRLR